MSRSKLFLPALLAALASASCTRSTVPPKAQGMACIERLTIPAYPPIASAARVALEGLTVSLRLAPDASVQSISFDAASDPASMRKRKLFEGSVESALRASVFRKDCGDQVVTIVIDFRLSGERGTDGRISLLYPNHFEVFDTAQIVNP
ncbi:MAG: hypothetical protein ND807_01905 [Vicinamibacterales bacterium]|nr:hypothetical protein [Vicinamibacterales bacterium]